MMIGGDIVVRRDIAVGLNICSSGTGRGTIPDPRILQYDLIRRPRFVYEAVRIRRAGRTIITKIRGIYGVNKLKMAGVVSILPLWSIV